MPSKPTIPQPLFPGDRATAPMALEDSSETTWKAFEELLSAHDMGFETTRKAIETPGPTEPAPIAAPQRPAGDYEATQVMPMASAPVVRPAVPAAPQRAVSIDDVMTLARRNNRACPMPPQWVAFHRLLPVREQQGRRIPAPPAIDGAAWESTSPMQKRLRLRDQIEWADRAGVLAGAYQFLSALPEDQWFHMG